MTANYCFYLIMQAFEEATKGYDYDYEEAARITKILARFFEYKANDAFHKYPKLAEHLALCLEKKDC